MNSITPLLIASLVVAIAGAAQPTFFRWPDGAATGDALSLFSFSVGQSNYGAKVQVART